MTSSNGIIKVLSAARFSPYLAANGGDEAAALRAYTWNIQVSAAFYPLLGLAEIGLRNAMHDQLHARFHRPDWWSVASLTGNGQLLVKRAREKAASADADDVVAQLSLGFWVSLTSRSNDRALWVPALHKAFPHYSGRRDQLHLSLVNLLRLRNRVMHHEPIHRRDLKADHDVLYRVCGYISADLVTEVAAVDTVPQVLERRDRQGA
ncbi:hypothetical protein [Lentzea sp. NEAU-D7]|uniref:hypothetical protein n=1 Tax=Lentzea sp. NEAU-D7 TaxID=2994667 RepID=UPI00224AFCE8|nr:hypothetical protein [Lentzea sp. NEAU-D7]MCX2950011.1 hypothetical protein [Lentzea sp. NEAU-D7]